MTRLFPAGVLLLTASCGTTGAIWQVRVAALFPWRIPEVRRQRLAELRITESSGLARSHRSRRVFWTHNDSGDSPRVFALDLGRGRVCEFEVTGARAEDWEDISSGVIGRVPVLLIADTGDNRRERSQYQLYLVEEPALAGQCEQVPGAVSVARTWVFSYPDGSHDCEAVALDPPLNPGRILLATKEDSGCAIYAISWKETGGGSIARKVAYLGSVSLVTGMDISDDGKRMTLITYHDAYEFVRSEADTWEEVWQRNPCRIKLPARRQGEAGCYTADAGLLVVTTEGSPLYLWQVPLAGARVPAR